MDCKDVIVLQAVPHSANEATITLQKLGDRHPPEETASNVDVSKMSKGQLLPCFQASSSSTKLETRIECQAAEKLPGAISSSTETKYADKFSREPTLQSPMEKRQEYSDLRGGGEAGSLLPGKINLVFDTQECRVCQLNLGNQSDCGDAMELGCACKDDLAVAHRGCAETWFEIKGNRICEICGVSAANVVGIKYMDLRNVFHERNPSQAADRLEARRWWKRLPFCNCKLLIALIIFVVMLPLIVLYHVGGLF